jgi:hypothetical protein
MCNLFLHLNFAATAKHSGGRQMAIGVASELHALVHMVKLTAKQPPIEPR